MTDVITFQLEAADIVAFKRHHLTTVKRIGERAMFVWIVILFILVAASVAANKVAGGFRPMAAAVPVVVVLGLIAVFVQLLIRNLPKAELARLARSGDLKKALARQRVTILDEGIDQANEFGAGMTRWTGVSRVDKTERHAFVYVNADAAMIIPARAFAAPGEFDEFVMRMRANAANAAGKAVH